MTVANSGFEYDGQWYASLSEIARLITGTRWSGPLFFGLKGISAEDSFSAHAALTHTFLSSPNIRV